MKKLSQAQETQLWLRWRQEGDLVAHATLAEYYRPYARIIAAKLYRNRYNDELEFNEYLSFAVLGMLEAIRTFDPEKEVTFKTFSSQRIHGAVLDGVHCGSEAYRQIHARKALLAERKLSPIPARDTFLKLVEANMGQAVGYMLAGSIMYQPTESVTYTEPGYAHLELKQLQDKLLLLVRSLPSRESFVIYALYFNQVALKDIAATLGVTKVRVCQLRDQAVVRLRRMAVELRLTDLAT